MPSYTRHKPELTAAFMTKCASPLLPTAKEFNQHPEQIALASYWDIFDGYLQKWISGSNSNLPAIALNTATEHFSVLSPGVRSVLLQEAVDMMEDFRLPDRAARTFKKLLLSRLNNERHPRVGREMQKH